MANIHELRFSGRDSSKEGTGFTIHAALADLNLETTTAALDDFLGALPSISGFNPNKVQAITTDRLADERRMSAGNREDKILLSYSDNVTFASHSVEIPCRPDEADLPHEAGSDLYDITVAPWVGGADFKAAFEAVVKSPLGNAVTLMEARLVGRNI